MTFELFESVLILACRTILGDEHLRSLSSPWVLKVVEYFEGASLGDCTVVWLVSLPVRLIPQAELGSILVNEEGDLLLAMSANGDWSRYVINSLIKQLASCQWWPIRWMISFDHSFLGEILLKINIERPLSPDHLSVSSSLLLDRACLSLFELGFISLFKIRLKHAAKITQARIPQVCQGTVHFYFWSLLHFILRHRPRGSNGWVDISRDLIARFRRHCGLTIRAKIQNWIFYLDLFIFLGM